MSDATPQSPLGAAGEVLIDLPCKRCGYNLRTLNEHGRCPECGTPVGLSVRGDPLRFSDPEWVDKIARGLNIIAWMLLLGLLLGLFAGSRAALCGALGQTTHPAFAGVIALLASLVSYYGVWLITTPDPGGSDTPRDRRAARNVRVALVCALIGQGLSMLLETGSVPTLLTTWLQVLVLVASLVALIGEFFKFVVYERIATRLPDATLAGRARFLRWAYVVTLGVTTIGGVVAALALPTVTTTATAPGGTGAFRAMVCFVAIAGLALLVLGVMTVFLILRLRRAAREQARLARATWAAGLAPPPAA